MSCKNARKTESLRLALSTKTQRVLKSIQELGHSLLKALGTGHQSDWSTSC